MSVPLIEREPKREINRPAQENSTTLPFPDVSWERVVRFGLNEPTSDDTGWKALQKYVGERRAALRWVSNLILKMKTEGVDKSNLEDHQKHRRILQTAQIADRKRLAGKR